MTQEKSCLNCLWDTRDYKCLKNVPRIRERLKESYFCDLWEWDLAASEIKKINKVVDEFESLDTTKGIRDELKEKYPHGHPKFLDLILDEVRLHSDKNHDFAKGGNPLGNFNRVGAILAQYPGLRPGDPVVVAIGFMLKQLDASLWMLSQGIKAKVEGHKERWRDVAVYAKIIAILIEEKIEPSTQTYSPGV